MYATPHKKRRSQKMNDGRTEAQKRADKKYRETKVKRIPLDVAREDADRWKNAAAEAGEALNVYIKKAVETRIKANDNKNTR